jgi:sortase (surface protein transpeptidase)
MPALRLRLIPIALLLCACAGQPQLAHLAAEQRPAARPLPTAAVVQAPDMAATARATRPAAPPAATPRPARHRAATRIVIGDIKLDQPLLAVGLDSQDIPIVPKHEPGWYTDSAAPGQGDNVVLWGHALRFRDSPAIPAPFGRLSELKPGASIVLYDEQGAAHAYAVVQQIWATPNQVEYILPQGHERLTLVSCIGDQVVASDGSVVNMTHRLITLADPI